MKIGIFTFHFAHNYGAVLQAYALMNYLKNKGCDVSIIDYNPSISRRYVKHSFTQLLSSNIINVLKGFILELLFYKAKAKRWDCFNNFIKNELFLLPFGNFHSDDFDYLIYGSDQIWNFKMLEQVDSIYLGELSIGKSVSYAASMGNYIPDKQDKKIIGDYLDKFVSISVREQYTKGMLSSMINSDIHIVCDPVFLIPKTEWEKHLPLLYEKKPYVLCYNLLNDPVCEKMAKLIAKQRNISIVEVTGSIKFKIRKSVKQSLSPFEFISYIRNAEMVVTSSFHGTAFSILFNKQFYSVGLGHNSGRVVDLLERLGLSDRYLEETTEDIRIVDYNIVDEKLSDMIKSSMDYLSVVK